MAIEPKDMLREMNNHPSQTLQNLSKDSLATAKAVLAAVALAGTGAAVFTNVDKLVPPNPYHTKVAKNGNTLSPLQQRVVDAIHNGFGKSNTSQGKKDFYNELQDLSKINLSDRLEITGELIRSAIEKQNVNLLAALSYLPEAQKNISFKLGDGTEVVGIDARVHAEKLDNEAYQSARIAIDQYNKLDISQMKRDFDLTLKDGDNLPVTISPETFVEKYKSVDTKSFKGKSR